ncbi:hypothetical protein QZM82_06595 [Burkholderia cepacia]|uniref:hypothetical protein n=1 Tax=Burkholderia cepacia TaxID=292 RepID=UPI002653D1FE|nr:hypothetical protein [Burkholderia cepacia]MDN7895862.1 hypothetical protein [Burkholderia cepacia]
MPILSLATALNCFKFIGSAIKTKTFITSLLSKVKISESSGQFSYYKYIEISNHGSNDCHFSEYGLIIYRNGKAIACPARSHSKIPKSRSIGLSSAAESEPDVPIVSLQSPLPAGRSVRIEICGNYLTPTSQGTRIPRSDRILGAYFQTQTGIEGTTISKPLSWNDALFEPVDGINSRIRIPPA